MLQFIIRLLIFIVAISLSLFIGVQWKLNEDLKHLSSQLSTDLDISYSSSALTPSGNIILKDVRIYSQQFDIEVTVNKIQYTSGSIFKMAFLKQLINSNTLPEKVHFKIDQAVIPLTPSLVKAIKAFENDNVWSYLNASACGDLKKIGINQYSSMGYDYIVFSTEANFYKDQYSSNLLGDGWLDIEETSQLNYHFNITDYYNGHSDSLFGSELSQLELLNLSLIDNGYNQHRNDFCSVRSNLSNEAYLNEHIKIIKKKLNSIGVKMTLSGQKDYFNFLKPNSELHFVTEPDPSFSMADFDYYNEQELREKLNFRLEINNKMVPVIFDKLDLNKIKNISLKTELIDENKVIKKRFQTVVIKREYKPESLGNAEIFVNYKIKLVKHNDKEISGKLTKVYKNRLYVAMNIQKGTVEVSINKKDIKEFSVYQ